MFHVFACLQLGFMVLVHKDFICYSQEQCGIHPSEAFQLLEFSLDVCMGLSHKGSVNHPLILGCLRVGQGVCLKCFTQSFIEISGGLLCCLDYHYNFGRIGGLFGSHSKSMLKSIMVSTQGFLSFPGIEIPIRSHL